MSDEVKKEILSRLRRNWKQNGASKSERDSDREWVDNLRHITTEDAFRMARAGTVIQIFEDGTDSQLDDLKTESEYYPDKTKNWPEIPTIFVVEE